MKIKSLSDVKYAVGQMKPGQKLKLVLAPDRVSEVRLMTGMFGSLIEVDTDDEMRLSSAAMGVADYPKTEEERTVVVTPIEGQFKVGVFAMIWKGLESIEIID